MKGAHVDVGIVTANTLSSGRVRVEIHSELGNSQHDCWVLQPYAGDGFGTFLIPEVNSEVLVAWIKDGTEPVVLGCLWYGGDQPPVVREPGSDPKLLQTKGGHKILLDDSENAEKIVIEAANLQGLGHQNRIEIDPAGKITIESETGKLVLKGGEIHIEATGSLNLQGATINLKGKPINLN